MSNETKNTDEENSTVTEGVSAAIASAALIGTAVGLVVSSNPVLGVAAISAGTASALNIMRRIRNKKQREEKDLDT